VGTVNNSPESLFQKVTVEFNGQIVCSASNFAFQCDISNRMNIGAEAKATHMAATNMIYKDTAGQMDELPSATCANKGLDSRSKLLAGGKRVPFRFRVNVPVFNTDKPIPNLIKVTVSFSRTTQKFVLMVNHGIVIYRMEKGVPARTNCTAKLSFESILCHTQWYFSTE
jgi:hypothetical protein